MTIIENESSFKNQDDYSTYARYEITETESKLIPLDPNWKPPNKNYCGEDLVMYFASQLLSEALGRYNLINKKVTGNIESMENKPLFHKLNTYKQRTDKVEKRLREKDCFYYINGGSVFIDYKIMNSNAFPKFGEIDAWVFKNLNPFMSTKRAYGIALAEVQTWWDLWPK